MKILEDHEIASTYDQVKGADVYDDLHLTIYDSSESGLLALSNYENFNLSVEPINSTTKISSASNSLSRYDGRGNFSFLRTDPSCVQTLNECQWN
eukprot:10985923-Karenia_brevis.AAC.1